VGLLWGDADVPVSRAFPYRSGRGDTREPVYARSVDTRVTPDGRTICELWPAMIEKAFATHEGGYAEIEGGRCTTVFSFAGAKSTNVDHSAFNSAQALLGTITAAVRGGHAVCVGTDDDQGEVGGRLNVVGNHAYVVWSVEDGKVRLFNPWGSSHPSRALSAEELEAVAARIYVGEF